MSDFKVGDSVRLKGSKRPQMTVTVVKDGLATCEWVNKEGDAYRRDYPLDSIEHFKRFTAGFL